MASVRKKQQTYKGKVSSTWGVYYTDGEGNRRCKTFKLKKEADAYRHQIETEIRSGSFVRGDVTMKVSDLLDLYLRYLDQQLKDKQIGKSYRAKAEFCIRLHLEPFFGNMKLCDLGVPDVERLHQRLSAKGLKTNSVKAYMGVLYRAEQYAVIRKYTGKTPTAEYVKAQKKAPYQSIRTFTQEEVAAILQAAEVRPKWFDGRSVAYLRLVVNIAAFCGLRQGEIFGLTVPCIDLDSRIFQVRHSLALGELKGPKTTAGRRDVPMPRHIAEMIREWMGTHYIANPRKLLFVQPVTLNPMKQGNFHGSWKNLLARAGVRDPEGCRFHALRHFAASFMIRSGFPVTDVADLLGHQRFDMTLQVYAHPMVEQRQRVGMIDGMAANILPPPAPSASV